MHRIVVLALDGVIPADPDVLFVDNGDVLTSAGATAQVTQFALRPARWRAGSTRHPRALYAVSLDL